jgi:hypothetical protein
MKNYLIVLAAAALAGALWFHQHARYQSLQVEKGQLTREVEALRVRGEQASSARQAAEQRLASLQTQVNLGRGAGLQRTSSTAPSAPRGALPPDPGHQGGWPAGAGYIYLPKGFLTNVSFRLLDNGRLTDEAATLLGMSPTEREAINGAFTGLLGQFRQIEQQKMQKINPPAEWGGPGLSFDSGLTYQIPSLSTDIQNLRQSFSQQAQQSLGDVRAQLLEQTGDAYFHQQLDDLGAGERTVGFLWKPESDGSHSLWYCFKDASRAGSFERVPEQVDPNSQIAYYAGLFGVKLPGQ